MLKLLFILAFISTGCTKERPQPTKEKPQPTIKKEIKKIKEVSIQQKTKKTPPLNFVKIEDLKKGECAKFSRDMNENIIIEFALTGKHSYAFFRHFLNGKKEFSSYPKEDFKNNNIKLERIKCPTTFVSLKDLHHKYLKNPTPYKGNNSDIEKVQIGQCVHYGSTVGKITAFRDDVYAIERQETPLGLFHSIHKKDLIQRGVITDCLNDLKAQYKKQNPLADI